MNIITQIDKEEFLKTFKDYVNLNELLDNLELLDNVPVFHKINFPTGEVGFFILTKAISVDIYDPNQYLYVFKDFSEESILIFDPIFHYVFMKLFYYISYVNWNKYSIEEIVEFAKKYSESKFAQKAILSKISSSNN